MFSKGLLQYTKEQLARRAPYLHRVQADFEAGVRDCDPEEEQLLRYYYATMPLSDMGAYPAELFVNYAKHALVLRRNLEWCKALPEAAFVHHVAYYRVNSEGIEPCRGEFFKMLYPRVLGKSIKDAILEVNVWCGENVRYAASDFRTASPLTVFRSGIGRCGEESTFAVTALRSVGIPARQVYVPRWAHCDDNHAWVEAYADGQWHFFGACEPEPVLDRGWFTSAAARGLVVHSRVFGTYPDDGQVIGQEGLVTFYNSTALYADTKNLSVQVSGVDGAAVSGAEVSLEIFNMAELISISKLTANADGFAQVAMGKGEIVAVAQAHGMAAAALVIPDETAVSLTLREDTLAGVLAQTLKSLDFAAPPAVPGKGAGLTAEQKALGIEAGKKIAALRDKKKAAFFDGESASLFPQAEALLRESRGNFSQILQFLSGAGLEQRIRMLRTLSKKDLLDVTCCLLESHYQAAMAIKDHLRLGVDRTGAPVFGAVPEDIFDTCILCPRVDNEELTEYRAGLAQEFSSQASFLQNPQAVADWITKNISNAADLDYGTLYAAPLCALRMGDANSASCHVLFVAICRSLGIPARLNPDTRQAEYYENHRFLPAWAQDPKAAPAVLRLHTEQPGDMAYRVTWTLARYLEGAFHTLQYTELRFDPQGDLELFLQPGLYRLITTARMPNGDQKVDTAFFDLASGEALEKNLALRQGELQDYLLDVTLPELTLGDRSGSFSAEARYAGKKRLFAFLEEGEPTEHVLNEFLEKGEVSFAPVFVVRSLALQNPTLHRVLKAVPDSEICVMDFDTQLEPLARSMFTDHEKLPVLLVTDASFHGRYATSGYRVGSVDLLEKLLAVMA